ncbi:IS3 family transposase [Burkholderia cenocepacia]|uniref:IS3 family transposase n=1 Tax=Burkholderia cenocepacia TaxID=95486 RepID=UPI00114CFC5E|nr:IS3 family transposase [Burkholderia cenocepacia]
MGKYTDQAKLAAARDYCSGESGLKAVAQRHGVNVSSLRQWIAGYRAHGEEGVRTKKRAPTNFSVEFKLSVLKRMHEEGLSQRQTAALFNIRRFNVIGEWEDKFNQGGPKALGRVSGERRKTMSKTPSDQAKQQNSDHDRSRQDLIEELNILRMENAYPKKARCLGSGERSATAKERTLIVLELRQHYPLAGLLQLAGLARSTFYYQQRTLQRGDKYADLKLKIRELFERHKGRYGYRRITAAIRRSGDLVNHKTVRRLMVQLRLCCRVRVKKYRSYKGQLGHVAPNDLARQFHADRPNEKWVTDVTEFNVDGRKLYLSPVLDLFNGEIVSYELSPRPLFGMVGAMLKKAFSRLKAGDQPMLHSDQGWQCRMPEYWRLLDAHAAKQSMSRKGNCLDNAAMESFFGTLKSEFYYLEKFRSVEELKTGIDSYIRYYNHDRIKLRLKGLSPVEYRIRFA